MHLREIHLVTDNLEGSVNFYAQTLGLKEIERESDLVALQGKDISSCLLLHQKNADVDEGLNHISFTVENLDSIIQKLKTADVDIKLENNDDGTQIAYFSSPENVMIGLTTAELPDMSGGEKTEIRIEGFALKTDDIEDSVQFYTQVLGSKEIEGLPYENNEDYVGLQVGNIVIELLSTGWFESEGFDHIDLTVNNLDNTAQKIKDADVDVEFYQDEETGETFASLYDPDEEVQIILSPLAENKKYAETQIPMSDEGNRKSRWKYGNTKYRRKSAFLGGAGPNQPRANSTGHSPERTANSAHRRARQLAANTQRHHSKGSI